MLLHHLYLQRSFCLEEVSEYHVIFDEKDITKYPTITLKSSTNNFCDDNIIWD